jgi:hypothetical protein
MHFGLSSGYGESGSIFKFQIIQTFCILIIAQGFTIEENQELLGTLTQFRSNNTSQIPQAIVLIGF